ncbi:DNA replication and repair protein RecR [Prosthecobacter fusiformis]|uniref:Recombination protein RecR n=1 Tax=Prosthecobacter fusiformis TaxID=48464 RepID=A0A4R7S6H2_9BACT|nr:recombination mediator RecR [Prosthecobacter fusiformis]TDU73276.1 DNA replication and repair protein RecR [Prosthecobacter fusiformis]
MPALDYPPPLQRMIAQIRSLPGLGPRSAERLVLWLMQDGGRIEPLIDSLEELSARVQACDQCGFFIERDHECVLCESPKRNHRLICVVEQAADVLRLERSGAFSGLYHVLGGKLSPLDNITPEDLRIDPLMERVKILGVEEVILAVGSDVEGEATASYLGDMLRLEGIAVSRLAQGMPAGGGLDHVDELTLYQALNGRRRV